ncbi:MAG: phosphoribosylanthranilate isomerase [Bacteroides sp.]|nr:phosphoribosylanthranilate isomerase [Bacteroides sp.]
MIVKVCGMTQAENIRAVEAVGIDWMGFIFHPRSPRCLTTVPDYLPTGCKRVGVFVNESMEGIREKARCLALDILQLHGSESPELCHRLKQQGFCIVKALPIQEEADLNVAERYGPEECDYLLFDTKSPNHGGSGRAFNWNILQAYAGSLPFLLSGGLSPSCLPALKAFRHPLMAGIDLNSGFELAPGIKDAKSLKQFVAQLNHE